MPAADEARRAQPLRRHARARLPRVPPRRHAPRARRLAHRELAVAIAEAAYRAGASAVDVEYEDSRVYAARILHASKDALGTRTSWQRERMRALGDENVAILQIMGEHELTLSPACRRNASPKTRSGSRPAPQMARIRREGRLRGTICAWPTDDWAARVFPGLERARRNGGSRRTCSRSAGSGRRTRPATRAGPSTSRRCAAGRRV